MSRKLPTHVSEICWCNPSTELGYRIETAKIKLPGQLVSRPTAWLDELLDGGFEIPTHKGGQRQALGILLTGPPGSGKSTFALELAYRWSNMEARDLPPPIQELTGRKPLQVLYATLDVTPGELIHNAASYQWKHFAEKSRTINSLREIKEGCVNVISFANIEMWQVGGVPVPEKAEAETSWLDRIGRSIKMWSMDFSGPYSDRTPPRPPDILILDGLNCVVTDSQREQFYKHYARLLGAHPLVVIFIPGASPDHASSAFWEYACDVVIKLDRHHQQPGDLYYVLRHLEIVKARFQHHAWGRHQMKIFTGLAEKTAGDKNGAAATSKISRPSERLRSHGYRTEGGIFIFPSIHFLLSGYEHMPAEAEDPSVAPQYYRPRVPNLGKILGTGFPVGCCTALVGQRGGHKSQLAYEELLYRVVYPNECRGTDAVAEPTVNENAGENTQFRKLLTRAAEPAAAPLTAGLAPRPTLLVPSTPKTTFLQRATTSTVPAPDTITETPGVPDPARPAPLIPPLEKLPVEAQRCEKALIVSMRDDEATTRRTMTKILNRWREFNSAVPSLDSLEARGLVEIMYFPPGYVTPEEFYHRILLSINRLKHGDESTTGVSILINGLDELATRFPICAREPIFIPGIIQMLAGEKVSSFFVAADESGHADYYGLDSMAGVILKFEHRDFPRDDVRLHLNAVLPGNQAIYNSESSKRKNQSLRRAVVVTVERFSGGQSSGAEGILELLDDDFTRKDLELGQAYAADYLIFIPRNHMQKGEFGFDTRAAVRGGILLNQ